MNINRKFIIIFGTLILLLVIITGAITYYKERKEQASIFENLQKRRIDIFSQNYPTSLNEVLDFIGFCKRAVFSGIEELENKKITEVACVLVKVREDLPNVHAPSNSYTPIFTSLDSISSFKPNRYIGISVDLKDVLREYDASLLEKDELYFCSISEPSWLDPFYLQMEPKIDLIFNEGDVSCAGIKMEGTHTIYFSGFVPQAESLNIKQYLVDEQTVSEVMSKQSFTEIKEILKDYPIIWQMEKPIIP
jgi:hypothetical protein